MSRDVDSFLAEIAPQGRSRNGDAKPMFVKDDTKNQEEFAQYEKRVDALFGVTPAYHIYRREKPQHRLLLWLKLQGHTNKEAASILGYNQASISEITRQPWFLEAFSRISTEMGKDAVEDFLTGEVVPTLQKLVSLRDTAESEQVQLSASNAILDRIRGKPTVKVETKNETRIDVAVADINKLEEQYAKNQETLRALGVHGNS